MTITQYSIIQHRRGLYIDLPTQLNTSELGHALDQGRIWIGNGQISEGAVTTGNTEIITNSTLLYNPQALQLVYISNTPVVAQTGTSPSTPVIRSLVQVLDDYVSVKDYGAFGNGSTGGTAIIGADDTAAINQALQNLFCVSIPSPYGPQMAYRTLFFPAGVYNISNYIYLPPNCTIKGEGQGKTIIYQTGTGISSVFRTADSLFQNGVAMGTNSATLPTNISVTGITFMHSADQDIAHLERTSNSTFTNCGFIGQWNGGTASTSNGVYFNILGTSYVPTNIQFNNCYFNNTNYVTNIDSNGSATNQVYFNNIFAKSCNWGINIGSLVSDWKINDSNFLSITNSALVTGTAGARIASSNNTFNTCGGTSVTVINIGSGATYCSSIGDKFINCSPTHITNSGTNSVILNNSEFYTLQNLIITPKQTAITLNGTTTNGTTGIILNVGTLNTLFLDYVLTQGTNSRIGRLSLYSNGTAASTVMGDLYTETAATNVTFNYTVVTGTSVSVVYTSTGTANSSWTVQYKTWLT